MSENQDRVPSVYGVRADGGMYTRAFIEGGYAGIGWFSGIDLSEIYQQGKDALQALYEQHEPNASKMHIAQNVGQIWRFLDELTPGTYVVTPMRDSSKLVVGRVVGNYFFESNLMDCPYAHRVIVEWAPDILMRNALSVPLQNTFKSPLTVFRVRGAEEILQIYGVSLPGTAKKTKSVSGNEITELIRKQVLDLTADEFEILVQELLSVIGFEAEHVGQSGDRGIDVKGILRVYEFASVELHVQVKRYSQNKIDRKTIRQFRGDVPQKSQAAFVTTSDFTKTAREEAVREGFKKVGLINGVQLIDILIEHYDDLSTELRDKLNLRKTLIPLLT